VEDRVLGRYSGMVGLGEWGKRNELRFEWNIVMQQKVSFRDRQCMCTSYVHEHVQDPIEHYRDECSVVMQFHQQTDLLAQARLGLEAR
jgi:hypothetical protein